MGIAAAVIPREWGQRLRYTRGNGDICCLPNDLRSQARAEPNVNLILAIPATSSSSERSFSTAGGRTLEKCRSQLKPSSVDGLMFMHGFH